MGGQRYRKRSFAEAKTICERDRKSTWVLDKDYCRRIEKPWPDLSVYDYIVINSSGGKDSAAAAIDTAMLARAAGVMDRVVMLHCDLGRAEWPGAPEAAKRQAQRLKIPFYVRSLIGHPSTGNFRSPNVRPIYPKGAPTGDLLEWVWRRHLQQKAVGKSKTTSPWPDGRNRYCTSFYKRDVAGRFYRELAVKWQKKHPREDRPCRLLDVVGIRCEESDTRCSVPSFRSPRQGWDTSYYTVDSWFPPFCLDTDDVWRMIRRTRFPVHKAYSLGMGRLSCPFCFFGNCGSHLIAGKHNPKLLKAYADMEKRTGWAFKPSRYSANDIITLLRGGMKPPKRAIAYTGNC
jgi:3'-phosphoadenosine 5'-phosphosulfate sulfotransferase (PAPS reductase)/FAD synthetase